MSDARPGEVLSLLAQMSPLFALAGLAEMAIAEALALLFLGLLLIGVIAIIGFFFKSRRASVIALVLACLLTMMSRPWQAFLPVHSDDPDVHAFRGGFQSIALLWIIVSLATVASTIRAFWSRRREPWNPSKSLRQAIGVHLTIVTISFVLWLVVLRFGSKFRSVAQFEGPVLPVMGGVVLSHVLAGIVGLLLPKLTKVSWALVLSIALVIPGCYVISNIHSRASFRALVYDRFRDNLQSPIPASVSNLRFVPLEEQVRPDLMFRFDIDPADLDAILERLKLARIDPKSMLNPKDFFQHPYYMPLEGEYRLFQGKDKFGEVLTIKTNESHSHAIYRRESSNFYKFRWWEEGNPILHTMAVEALAAMKAKYEAEHGGGAGRE
jgi:hypothetical protein